MCTHGEVLLQRVSTLLLQVDRKEVARGCDGRVMERVHTRTRGHGDISVRNNDNMKKYGSKMDKSPLKNGGYGLPR